MTKHEKILEYIAKKRLGFFYVYQDTTFGAYGDAPKYIVITQTQGRDQVEIAKVAFDTYENAIERAVTILKINEEQVIKSGKVSPDMVVLNGMMDFSPPVKTETEKV